MRRVQLVWCLSIAVLTVLSACGESRFPGMAGNDSTLVGGPCMAAGDCDFLLCQTGDAFPGGLCTLSCGTDNDCPSGSSCAGLITGWVCLVDCATTEDCREQWTCQTVTRPSSGEEEPGTFLGCLGPEDES